MINAGELRIGNYILQKIGTKISPVKCTFSTFEALANGDEKLVFPVTLKAEILEKCGFIENKDYPLYPQAREFRLVLPVSSEQKNEIVAYIKSNGESFGRANVNGLPASNNIYNLHSLQNLYYAVTGQELAVKW